MRYSYTEVNKLRIALKFLFMQEMTTMSLFFIYAAGKVDYFLKFASQQRYPVNQGQCCIYESHTTHIIFILCLGGDGYYPLYYNIIL
jgi:hypothetical protein